MERPILFSTPMVRAILSGEKLQTRRILKRQPHISGADIICKIRPIIYSTKHPYGEIGDILWVRETWQDLGFGIWIYKADDPKFGGKWKPSIFMPKYASRIKLEITNIRAERLQDISYEDAVKEGIESSNEFGGNEGYLHQYKNYQGKDFDCDSIGSFLSLWESINGEGSWYDNPWVWVIEFKKL